VQVCAWTGGLTGVGPKVFAGLLSGVAAIDYPDGVGGRPSIRGTADGPISVVGSSEMLAGVAGESVLASEVGRAHLGLALGVPGRESVDCVPGDPDGSADSDARDGVAGDELVEQGRGRAEVPGGLGDGEQAWWRRDR